MMGDYFNDDFRDFIKALNNHQVEYILVGGMAVILHGYVRTTGDMDIWVKRTKENYRKLTLAFAEFQMPMIDLTEKKFLSNKFNVWSFGRKPVLIEILTDVKGIDFDEAFKEAIFYTEEGVDVRFLHINSLIQSKKAAGRYKDLDDIEQLTKE
jgi:acyl carrier protein phosphodiesterase